jgi:ribosomal protein S18 acetylase RimI-like enzyme
MPGEGEPATMIEVVEVEAATEVTVDLVAAFARLVPQLSPSASPPGADQLAEMIAHPGTTVLVARIDGVVVGVLTLVVFRIPTGVRAWIEDVVVDEGARGKGVGEALSRAALDRAAAQGARTVELTSRPSREAANRLYQRLGFRPRETNVYRIELGTG